MLSDMFDMFVQSFWETLIMVGISGAVGALIGLPLGVLLYLTDRQGVLQHVAVNRVLGTIVNAVRSTPFIILLVLVIPFTRLIVGSSIGTAAAVVPLTLASAPFIGRLVETALREVDRGLIERRREDDHPELSRSAHDRFVPLPRRVGLLVEVVQRAAGPGAVLAGNQEVGRIGIDSQRIRRISLQFDRVRAGTRRSLDQLDRAIE